MKHWPDIPLIKTLTSSGTPATDGGATLIDSTLINSAAHSPQPVSPVRHIAPQPFTRDRAVLSKVLEQTANLQTRVPARAKPVKPTSPEQNADWTLPGFERKCRVSTIFGDLPIEALRRRDKVKTLSGAFREVEWIDEIRLDADFMSRHPEAQPVQIRAKAFGGPQPCRNILVSPGQDIWLPTMFGANGPSKVSELIGKPSVMRIRRPEITYYRFHCGSPETVSVENAWFCVAP